MSSLKNSRRNRNILFIGIFIAGVLIGIFLELFLPLFNVAGLYENYGFWGFIGRVGLILFIMTLPVGYFLWLVMGVFQISRVREPEETIRRKHSPLDVKQINRILLPIGDGPNAQLGLQLISQLTTLDKSGKITLLRIIPPSMKKDVDKQRATVLKHAHESLLDTQRDFEIDIEIRISNDVTKPTLELAKDGMYDLLVVGATERSHVGKLLFGSIALTLAEQAPCPVIIVRRNIKQEDQVQLQEGYSNL